MNTYDTQYYINSLGIALLLLDVICGYMILNHLLVHSSHHAQVRKEVMFALLRDDNKKKELKYTIFRD